MACKRLTNGEHPLLHFLDKKKFDLVVAEAKDLLPHASGLVASEALKKQKKHAHRDEFSISRMMGGTAPVGSSRDEVRAHALFVHAWLVKADSPLRQFLGAASDGGVFFVANVHQKTAVAYAHHRRASAESSTAGVGVEDFVKAAQCRLCD